MCTVVVKKFWLAVSPPFFTSQNLMGNIKSYKGFNKDLVCRDYQYEVGQEYSLPKGQSPSVCNIGFHACESPLEVLDYYFLDDNANMSRFCEVEQSGELSRSNERGSTKVASSKIKIKAEIKFADLIKLGVEWLKEKTSPSNVQSDGSLNDNGEREAKIGSSGDSAKIGSSGYSAQIGSSGDYAKIGSSGDYAKIGSSGDYAQIGSSGDSAKIGSSGYSAKIGSSGDSAQIGSSGDSAQIGSSGYSAQIGSSGYSAQIDSTGQDSVIMCAGHDSRAKAKKGSWITLAEWFFDDNVGKWRPKCVKTEYVDGERIKEDTWYKLVKGKSTED